MSSGSGGLCGEPVSGKSLIVVDVRKSKGPRSFPRGRMWARGKPRGSLSLGLDVSQLVFRLHCPLEILLMQRDTCCSLGEWLNFDHYSHYSGSVNRGPCELLTSMVKANPLSFLFGTKFGDNCVIGRYIFRLRSLAITCRYLILSLHGMITKWLVWVQRLNLNWGYEHGSQSGLKLHHLLIQSIRLNQYQNNFFYQIFIAFIHWVGLKIGFTQYGTKQKAIKTNTTLKTNVT